VKKPKVLVLRAPGINCELELANAFKAVGGDAELVHISEISGGKKKLMDYGILAIPGGFS
jgi:phosphoribosylformylglycinamidine (FGAM) synthase-like amidotransferase family enzyme